MKDPRDKTPPDSSQNKSDSAKSKKFDTTTQIRLNSTFDADEITLVDEMPSSSGLPEQPGEDSVTQKINPSQELQPSKKEDSKVTRRLLQIEKEMHGPEANIGDIALSGVGRFVSNIKDVLSNRQTKNLAMTEKNVSRRDEITSVIKPRPALSTTKQEITEFTENTSAHKKAEVSRKNLPFLFKVIGGSLLFVLIVFGCQKWWQHRKAGRAKAALTLINPVSLTAKAPRVTPLEVLDLKDKPLDKNNIKRGSTIKLHGEIIDWQDNPNANLQLTVDLRVNSGNGQIVLNEPHFIKYSEKTDITREKIALNTTLNFLPATPPGFYRILLSVTDTATGRKTDLQTSVKIVP